MFLFLGPTYFLSDYFHSCSETGDIAVEDLTTCKEAAEKLGLQFKGTENRADWPKGCYKYGSIRFNQHRYGSFRYGGNQICKGMSLRSFLTSMHLLLIFIYYYVKNIVFNISINFPGNV